jgi:hypothetical protein
VGPVETVAVGPDRTVVPTGWRDLPDRRLYGELGLVNLLQLIPSMENYYRQKGYAR